MTRVEVYAVGNTGRRLVHRIFKRQRAASYTIARINHKGEWTSSDRGGRTLAISMAMSQSILISQRFTDIEFKRVRGVES